MRTYLSLEKADESDLTNSARRGSGLESSLQETSIQSAIKGSRGGESSSSGKGVRLDPSAGGSGEPRQSSSGEPRRKDAGPPPGSAAEPAAAAAERPSRAERRSHETVPPPPEGEAVMMRRRDSSEEGARADAQERVFGDRRKSVISVEQLRGSTTPDSPTPPSLRESSSFRPTGRPGGKHGGVSERQAAAALEEARRAHAAKLREWDAANVHWVQQQQACHVPKGYDGLQLPRSPPTKEDIERLIGAFTNPEPAVLHQRFLLDVLLQVMRQWECPPPGFVGQTARAVVDLAEPPEGSRLLIVGDTHGQLADVLWIFTEYGLPSKTNVYLFNGDVADRGSHAVEIFVLLFSCMLAFPGSVYLSRGNHENMEINERAQHYGGGFAEEVRSKYDPEVFMLFSSLFELLPLAFVVAQKALVIHGGLWRHRGVTLNQLRQVAHRRQCPEAPQTYDDYIFFDLLWSDPHPEDGDGVHESSRGDGCILFGRDMTVEFLRRNSLQLIVRSHQLPSDGHGYEVLHDGRCITVFSASNYGGSCYNAGAILVWEGGEIDAHEFIAPNLEAQAKARGGEGYDALLRRFSSRGAEWEEEVGCAAEPPHVARLDGEIVRMIKERVCRHRHQLAAEFAKLDRARAGRLTIEQWSKGLEAVLRLDISWAKYQPWLAELTEANDIDYPSFLSRFEVRLREQYAGWQRTVLQMFYNSLLAADLQITELLGFFDEDGDGMVSLAECTKALEKLKLGLSTQQIKQLVLHLGFDDKPDEPDGRSLVQIVNNEPCVDLEAYLKRLAQVADHTVIARSEQELQDLQQVARWIEGVAAKSGKSLSQLFMSWDDNSDGFIDYEEFVTCCFACQEQLYLQDPSSLEYIYTREEFDELARTVDQAKTGRINYLSFLGLFSSAESATIVTQGNEKVSPLLSRTSAATVFIEHICTTIWSNDVLLSKALRTYDSKGTGSVTPQHMQKALEAMNANLAEPFTPLTATQVVQVVQSLPLDADGKINYKEFMAAFEVRDKYQEA